MRFPRSAVSVVAWCAVCTTPLPVAIASAASPIVTSTAKADTQQSNEALLKALDGVVRGAANGSAVGYRKGDGALWAKSAGTVTRSGSEKVTDAHAFRAASINKPLTALIAMMEVEAGRLTLETTVHKVLPGALPGHGEITLRQLLNHTSGMPCHLNDTSSGFWREADADFLGALRKPRTMQQIWAWVGAMTWAKPGQKYYYSNAGYATVGAMIEKVTGRSMKDNIEQRILQPLGMTSSRYATEPDPGIPWVREYKVTNGRVTDLSSAHPSLFGPSASLVSNPTDLTAFWHGFYLKGLVSKTTIDLMLTPTPQAKTTDGSYGLGVELWKVKGEEGFPVIGHTGGAFGTLSYAFIRPANGSVAAGHVSTRTVSSGEEQADAYRSLLRNSFSTAGVVSTPPRSDSVLVGTQMPQDLPFLRATNATLRHQNQ